MSRIAAIYCRLSEEDRNKQFESDDSESIKNQKLILQHHAIEQGWEIYDYYIDDDYGGGNTKRPEFNRLIDDAKNRKFDTILCKTQSRFTRELEVVEKYIHGYFPEWGIRFIGLLDNADTDVEGNKKSRQINALLNEWYLEDLSVNIKKTFSNKRKQGSFTGAFPLYGYLKDPNQKGHLIVDEEAAKIVKEVFDLYIQGYGKSKIAQILNNRGVPNPTGYKSQKNITHRKSDAHKGTLWSYYTISDMLNNEMYIGNMVQGRYGSVSYKTGKNKPKPKDQWVIVKGTHEAIIDIDVWNAVQGKVKANFKPFSNGEIGLFARIVKCKHCDYTMRSSKSRGKHYLKCAEKQKKEDACIGSFIPVDLLKQIVIKQLNQFTHEYLDKDEFEQKLIFQNNFGDKMKSLEKDVSSYNNKIDECLKVIDSLYIDKAKGMLGDDDFIRLSRKMHQDKKQYEDLISELQLHIEEVKRRMQQADNRKALIEQYSNITDLDRPTVEKLIDCIYIGDKDPVTKQRYVEIHWNF